MHNIYIYNHTTNVFTKNENDDLNTILLKGELAGSEIGSVYAIKGLTQRLIIVLGTTCYSDTTYRYPFYSLFDSKSLSFVKIGSKLFNNDKIGTSKQLKNEKAIYNIEDNNTTNDYLPSMNRDELDAAKYLPLWSRQSRFNKYKNYLLFTHKNILGVYDISDEYNPMLLMYAKLGGKIVLAFHGCVILSCHMSDDNINNNNNIVKLLLFGGYGIGFTFLTSFFEYEINFDEMESQLKEQKIEILTNVFDDDNSDIDDKILSNILKQTKNDILSKSLNFQGLKDAAEKVKLNLNKTYGIFEYTSNLYNSRHLMIYGLFKPSMPRGGLNMIINFDVERKTWTMVKDIWPISQGCCWKGHGIIRSKYKGNWLQTMGGIVMPAQRGLGEQYCTKSHFAFRLNVTIDWSIERLLWIGYLKNNNDSNINDNNNNVKQSSCLLSTLPKDII